MVHVSRIDWEPLRRSRWFAPFVICYLLSLAIVAIHYELPFANKTNEDDYMPVAGADLIHGRNPYAEQHHLARNIDGAWDQAFTGFDSAYVYFPALALLQIPFVDYRFTALLAYAGLLWALRHRPAAFLTFGNPFGATLAASGFNDFVPLALIAWALRLGLRWPLWIAAAAKQFVLPILLLAYAWRRDARNAAWVVGITGLVLMPFVLWDVGAFWANAVLSHVTGQDAKLEEFLTLGHPNYWLWVAAWFSVFRPAFKARPLVAPSLETRPMPVPAEPVGTDRSP